MWLVPARRALLSVSLAADLALCLALPDDTQVTELAAEQQSSVGEEDGFVFSDTF